MALVPIDTLLATPTEDQVFDGFIATLETLGIRATTWRVGGTARTILRVVAKAYLAFALVVAASVRSFFLETATGSWLTLLAANVYGVARPPASFANGQVQVSNTLGGVYPQAAGAVRFLGATGKAYTNVAAFVLNPGATLTLDVSAVELGSASSAAPNTITRLETTLVGVTVTNPEAVVGSDGATDVQLRALCKAKLAAISVRGPRGAYEYAVNAAVRLDGSPVDVNRSQISRQSSTGTVTVYCASPSGAPSGSDLGFIRDSIEAVARPDSVTCNVLAATEVPLTRTLTVWARRVEGLSATDLEALVNAALIAAITDYPIGGLPKPPSTQGYLYADFIAGVVKSAHASVYDTDGTGSDVALNPGEVVTLATTLIVKIMEV